MASVRVEDVRGVGFFTLSDIGAFKASSEALLRLVGQTGDGEPSRLLSDYLSTDTTADRTRQHTLVCTFLETLRLTGQRKPDAEQFSLPNRCLEFSQYLTEKARESGGNKPTDWLADGISAKDRTTIEIVTNEIVSHVSSFYDTPDLRFRDLTDYTAWRLAQLMPPSVAELRHEANLPIFFNFFERALDVPGDVCEFGCFRGNLSVKLAWILESLKTGKHYFAFDTFGGFEINDPGGGELQIGAFDNNDNAFEVLSRWGKVLPLTPVKGDATKTAATLTKPLSFVWLDLDMAVLMDPVLRQIWSLCSEDTMIGIDDVGRPETPTVAPWVDRLVSSGAAELIYNSDDEVPGTCIRVVQKRGPLSASFL